MTAINEDSIVQRNDHLLSSERNVYVPQQLIEASKLLDSISGRLEDCAFEWQAEISRKQWKIFNTRAMGKNLAEQSFLSRTYFTEKNLDEAFQHLLSCNKIFSEYLKDFIALLSGERSTLNVKETRCTQNQYSDTLGSWKLLSNVDAEAVLPLLKDQEVHTTRKSSNLKDNMSTVQKSFGDVIRAKVNFDTKFLGFEAVLHKTTSTPTDATCLCQYCSNIMKTGQNGHKKLKNIRGSQTNRRISRKTRHLTRSTKSSSRKREKEEPSLQIGDTGDQLSFGANINFC